MALKNIRRISHHEFVINSVTRSIRSSYQDLLVRYNINIIADKYFELFDDIQMSIKSNKMSRSALARPNFYPCI